MRKRVTREETRYKGVWDAGRASGYAHANDVIRRFVQAGGQFSADSGRAWDMNTLALKLGNHIAIPESEIIVHGMEALLHKNRGKG